MIGRGELYSPFCLKNFSPEIYEGFFEEIVKDWIRNLPNINPNYSDLEQELQERYPKLIAELLLELSKNKKRRVFENLSFEKVLQDVSRCLAKEDIAKQAKYNLVPEAFLLHNQNLRKETLENLLTNAGIPNSWKWIQINRHIKNFIEYTLGEENTVEGQLEGKLVERQLKEFVNYRNDAAHGALMYNVLSSQKLLNLCDFIDVFCQAITELVTHQMVVRQESMRQVKKIGKVTRWFPERQATHAKVKETTIFRGCNLFLVSETKAYCQSVKVISIMVEKDEKWLEKESVEVSSEAKIGLKFDCDVIKDLDIVQPIESL